MRLSHLVLTCALLLCTFWCQAQECQYKKNETDKFTNARSLLTEPLRIVRKNVKQKGAYNIQSVDMQVRAEGDSRAMVLTFSFALGYTVANQESKAILLLSNGDRVELPCRSNMPTSQFRKGIERGVAVMTYDFDIDNDAFQKLTHADITDIRVTSAVNPVDLTLEEGVQTYSLFRCIK